MTLVCTQKEKITITILCIWFIVSTVFIFGGIMIIIFHTQDLSNLDMDVITNGYLFASIGYGSFILGSVIIFVFVGNRI